MKNFTPLIITFLFLNLGLNAQNIGINRIKKADSQTVETNLIAQAPEQYFLKIEGIEGSSTDLQHLNWIEINSFVFNMAKKFINGMSTGNATSSFMITKSPDISSVNIAFAFSTNQNISTVLLEVTKVIKNKKVVVLKYQFNDVNVSMFSVETEEKNIITEKIKLEHRKLIMTYFTYDNNGNLIDTNEKEIISSDRT